MVVFFRGTLYNHICTVRTVFHIYLCELSVAVLADESLLGPSWPARAAEQPWVVTIRHKHVNYTDNIYNIILNYSHKKVKRQNLQKTELCGTNTYVGQSYRVFERYCPISSYLHLCLLFYPYFGQERREESVCSENTVRMCTSVCLQLIRMIIANSLTSPVNFLKLQIGQYFVNNL